MCTIEVENQRQGVVFYPVCVYNRSRESASGSRVLPCVCTIEVENQRQGVALYPVCTIEVENQCQGVALNLCVYNRSRESVSGSRVLPSVCTIEVENQCQGIAFYPVCVQ